MTCTFTKSFRAKINPGPTAYLVAHGFICLPKERILVLKVERPRNVIAISYRREDTAPITGRIYDRLQAIFSRDQVFMDLDSIPFGVDFRTHISESLNRCHILLVVIGPRWLGVSPDGSRRIDDPTDFVRLEVAQALARKIKVIPLLIDRTEMPSSSSLPEDLKSLAFRNALRVDSGADFHHHINRLCSSLRSTASS